MILAQYNPIGFYASLEQTTWKRNKADGGNEELFRVFYPTNRVPAFSLIVDAATTATVKLCNTDDEEISSAMALSVDALTGYKQLKFSGANLSGLDNGDYYLKITNGTDTYYSDIFGWTDDTSELLKISAVSSDIRLGRDYVPSLTGLTIEGYINAEYLGITPEVDEESATRYGATRVLYANLVPTREFNIYGCEYIYRFLLGLRVLEVNGTVSITWNGLTYTANDIMVEKTDEHTPELMFQISLKFVDISEVISVVNETN